MELIGHAKLVNIGMSAPSTKHTYNMNNLHDLARHVVMKYYAPGESAKDYCAKVATRYKVDLTELIAEVKRIRNG